MVGNKIPREFFITKGTGESDITVHAGSYHLALCRAGIERCNIMYYSSILPGIAREIPKTQETLEEMVHGSVMDTIMACAHAFAGERATAGITFGWLFDKETKKKYGGLVCEYNGDYTEADAKASLKASLNELYTNGYSHRFELRRGKLITASFVPKKKHGTALVALCFLNYQMPILGYD
jgi:arginine decarboxylase